MRFDPEIQVYLAVGATDMRKAINGLSILVSSRWERIRSEHNTLHSAIADGRSSKCCIGIVVGSRSGKND